MNRHLLSALFAASVATPLAAQRQTVSLDAAFGAGSAARQASISIWRPLLRGTGRLHAGAGVRASAFGGDATDYANREAPQGGLTSTVSIDPAVYSLNAAVFADYRLSRRLALGANLDLLGVAVGPERSSGTLAANPQGFSYFRFGTADRGALNSEFFAAVAPTPGVRIRAGASHYVTNYIVTDAAAGGATSRYQRFETVPFIAISIQL